MSVIERSGITHNSALSPTVVQCNLGVDLDRLELAPADTGEGAGCCESGPAKVRGLRWAP